MRWAAFVPIASALLTACDPCSGTPSCHMEPEVSYSGQFIEFPSGKAVAGVGIEFTRRTGARTLGPSAQATSDGDGFFTLRMAAIEDGPVVGDLTVTPPPPHKPYTVRNITLETHRVRGDGGFLGRFMVNPYLELIGEVHDRRTFAVVAGASIVVHPRGPAVLEAGGNQLSGAENGRFMWEPKVVTFDDLIVDFEISAPGYPRPYLLRDTIRLLYRDQPQEVLVLVVGGGWVYVGEVIRRGTKEYMPGVTVEFVRTGGIRGQPEQFMDTADARGRFDVPIEPIGDGVMIGDLIIRPPAPIPPEIVRNVRIATFDGGAVLLLGPYGYGAATIARPRLVYRASGRPVRTGTHTRFTRVGGLEITPAPWGPADSGVRIGDSAGVVGYDAATADAGTVLFDLEVRLNEPHEWETIRALPVPARYSDSIFAPTFRVGKWFPWTVTLRSSDGAPIAGAQVLVRRVGGAQVSPSDFKGTSAADGSFPLQAVPLSKGPLDVRVTVRAPAYRDTTFQLRLVPTQDDTVRSIGVIQLQRSP